MRTSSLLLACSVATVLLTATPARAENLIDVYQAALRGDPVLREAEMRRRAALEAKPQARGLLLPQVDVTGQYTTQDSDGENVFLSQDPETGQIGLQRALGVRCADDDEV